jgi:hypothetical protein
LSSIADGPGDEALAIDESLIYIVESGLASRSDIVALPRPGTGAVAASVAAFGGNPSFSPSRRDHGRRHPRPGPHPGGVPAVEAALIGGRAAFGVPAAIAVPSVLLYRALTCRLLTSIGSPIIRWLTKNDDLARGFSPTGIAVPPVGTDSVHLLSLRRDARCDACWVTMRSPRRQELHQPTPTRPATRTAIALQRGCNVAVRS